MELVYRFTGIKFNQTNGEEREPLAEPSALLMVLITMAGRISNVVGTMKMYKVRFCH